MKKIEAIIRHHRVDSVTDALVAIGVTGITLTEVKGLGRQLGKTEVYRGTEYNVNFVPKSKMEIIVEEEMCHAVIVEIVATARTGELGDGKIFVTDLEDVIRIRTGESAQHAI